MLSIFRKKYFYFWRLILNAIQRIQKNYIYFNFLVQFLVNFNNKNAFLIVIQFDSIHHQVFVSNLSSL